MLEKYSADWSSDSIRLHNTPSSCAKKLYFYIQECGDFKTVYPYYTERAQLNSFLMVYTVGGSGTLSYEGKTYTLHAGELFFIDCNRWHAYQCVKDATWEFRWFHFNGSNATGYYEEVFKNGFRILKPEPELEQRIQRIIALTARKTAQSEPLISGIITQILTELIAANLTDDDEPIVLPEDVKHAARTISQRFRDVDFRIEELSKSLAFSHTYLSREFKKHMGVTMKEYLILCRLDYAKELLKYSNLSVAEIAYEIGMNHVSHFIDVFKEREAKTPLAYRNEWNVLTQ